MHTLNNCGHQSQCTHFVEVTVGAYTLAEWNMKIECCIQTSKLQKKHHTRYISHKNHYLCTNINTFLDNMKSIKELYRIGTGPSSSHTMAPRRAAEMFQHRNPECRMFRVTLYGSLAATGKGHLTDQAIFDTLPGIRPDRHLHRHHRQRQLSA